MSGAECRRRQKAAGASVSSAVEQPDSLFGRRYPRFGAVNRARFCATPGRRIITNARDRFTDPRAHATNPQTASGERMVRRTARVRVTAVGGGGNTFRGRGGENRYYTRLPDSPQRIPRAQNRGPEPNQICGDWAGYAQEYLEVAHPGAVAITVIGCGADSNPAPRLGVELAQQHGRTIATAVTAVLNQRLAPLRQPLVCG